MSLIAVGTLVSLFDVHRRKATTQQPGYSTSVICCSRSWDGTLTTLTKPDVWLWPIASTRAGSLGSWRTARRGAECAGPACPLRRATISWGSDADRRGGDDLARPRDANAGRPEAIRCTPSRDVSGGLRDRDDRYRSGIAVQEPIPHAAWRATLPACMARPRWSCIPAPCRSRSPNRAYLRTPPILRCGRGRRGSRDRTGIFESYDRLEERVAKLERKAEGDDGVHALAPRNPSCHDRRRRHMAVTFTTLEQIGIESAARGGRSPRWKPSR